MNLNSTIFSSDWLRLRAKHGLIAAWRNYWAATRHERLRQHCQIEAIAAANFGLRYENLQRILLDCDWPVDKICNKSFAKMRDQKGFWRVDKTHNPEHRLSVLTQVAFYDLERFVCDSETLSSGISTFLNQNNGEGWQLPETLRLADYGLGHDDRAREHQPVRECFGPRFYDWQLEQDPEESWRECHLHARNLLGPAAYQALLDELASDQGSVTGRQSHTVREEASEFRPSNDGPANQQSFADPDEFKLSAEPGKRPKK